MDTYSKDEVDLKLSNLELRLDGKLDKILSEIEKSRMEMKVEVERMKVEVMTEVEKVKGEVEKVKEQVKEARSLRWWVLGIGIAIILSMVGSIIMISQLQASWLQTTINLIATK